MSVKSSFFYVVADAVEGWDGASIHVYTDVSNDKILMDLSYGVGTYGTQLGVQLGSYDDAPLRWLLEKIERAIDRGMRCVNCGHDQEHLGRACGSVYGPPPERRCACENYLAALTEPQNGQRAVDAALPRHWGKGLAVSSSVALPEGKEDE